MKTIITSLIAITLGMTNVNATETNTVAAKKEGTKTFAIAAKALTYQQMAKENIELKLAVAQMENDAAEMQSQLQYSKMMGSMFAQLEKQQLAEREEEMKAELAYNKMMAAMFLQLKSKQ